MDDVLLALQSWYASWHWGDVPTWILAIATPVSIFYGLRMAKKQLEKQTEQALTEHYSAIITQMDMPNAKNSRRILYRSHSLMAKLVKDYSNRGTSVLDDLNEVARYTAGIYDGMYFLLS